MHKWCFKTGLFLTLWLVAGCDVSVQVVGEDEDNGEDPDEQVFTLSVDVDPADGGGVDPETGEFDEGETVTVEALPNDGWLFTSWSGAIDSQENPLVFTMEDDTELTAHFEQEEDPEPEPQTFQFSASVDPAGSGSVDPASGEFEEGETVTVQAEPEEGWRFDVWSGDLDSQENPLAFTIEEDTEVTAHFEDITSEYLVDMDLSVPDDGLALEDELMFGQQEDPQSLAAPPAPPAAGLHAYFERDGDELWEDVRSHMDTEVTWQLFYEVGSGNALTLHWHIDADRMPGTLVLTDDQDGFEVDMAETGSHQINPDEHEYLQIRYRLDE